MDMADLIRPDRVIADLRAPDKAQLLNELSRRAAKALGIDTQIVLDALRRREGLGTTGIGQGIAIPHARVEALQQIFGLFAHLEHTIDFAAIDAQPVDLVFLLLTPENAGNEHLAALACVSRRLRDHDVAQGLRAIRDGRTLYAQLVGPGSATEKLA
jgi:PTS system nitrogen regulatory IIA component